MRDSLSRHWPKSLGDSVERKILYGMAVANAICVGVAASASAWGLAAFCLFVMLFNLAVAGAKND